MRPRMIVAFLGPALLLYLGFLILPALQAFYLSFFETSGFGDQARFVGLANYSRLAGDPVFWRALRNMVLILVLGGIVTFGLAFLFTMLLNAGMRGKKLFRALIFLPNVIAVVAITTFWSFVFMPRYGMLTSLLKLIGLTDLAATAWTAPENVFYAMMVGLIWISVGFYTILVLAGADKISTEMYEAARLEGANTVQIFRMITLPMIWDIIAITLVLWAIQAIKIVEFPYAFGGPNIDQNLYTPAIYLYIMGFGQRDPVYALGYATAIGVVLFALTLVTVVGLRLAFQRERLEY